MQTNSGSESARATKKEGESQEKVAKTAIAGKMGEASIARIAGGRRISFKTQHRATHVVGESDFRMPPPIDRPDRQSSRLI